jgi:hypothetical protein
MQNEPRTEPQGDTPHEFTKLLIEDAYGLVKRAADAFHAGTGSLADYRDARNDYITIKNRYRAFLIAAPDLPGLWD